MYSKRFNKVVEDRIRKIKDTLASKGKEYSTDDKLHNFKKAGRILNCSKEEALRGMLMKHIVSVDDLINNLEFKTPSIAVIDEKLGDIINYYILLEACLVERLDEREQEDGIRETT